MRVKNAVITRFTFVGIVLPAIVSIIALSAQLLWMGDLPDPAATHWGLDGVDGYGPAWSYLLITAVLGFGLGAWLALSALPRLRRGSRGWSFRFLAAMSLGMSVFGAISMTYAVWIQVDIDSWQDAPNIAPGIFVGAGLGLAAGLLGWFVQPKQVLVFEELPAAHVDLAAGERVVWLGNASAGRAAVIVLVVAVALLALGAVAAWIAAEFALTWIFAGLAVLIGALGLTTMEADVRVDAAGVEVRGPAGWPRSRVPIAEIASATAVTVDPLGSFGGWGWRRVPGAMGVVLRSGEGLRVERKEGHALVVTVDDAATAAALLTALAARAGA